MKKSKLSLEELSVNSFITNSDLQNETVVGGNMALEIATEVASQAAGSGCTFVSALGIVPDGIKIIKSIANSNANTDCAGATRTNCNDTFFPCKV